MDTEFGANLSYLRREAGLNQRQLAAQLKISQALLSHYENGSREPGLAFVCRVCDYFDVTADFVLGRGDVSAASEHISAEIVEMQAAAFRMKNPDVTKAAHRYLNAAAVRMTARIIGKDIDLRVTQQAIEMSKAELELIQALSDI